MSSAHSPSFVTSPTSQRILILQAFCHFTYITAHSPTLPSFYLHRNSFSNPSVASPTSQLILQPFFQFSYVTGFSLTSPGEPPMQERGSSLPASRGLRVQVTWLKASTLAEIQEGGHPPYSPDLSPCDYAISCPLKKALMGKRITSDDDIKQYVRNWFTMQPWEFYQTVIHCLVSQWFKCLNSQDQYFRHTGTGFCS